MEQNETQENLIEPVDAIAVVDETQIQRVGQPIADLHSASPIVQAAALMAQSDGKIDVADLKELLAMQREHETNEARKAFVDAMAEFHKDAPRIVKDRTVGYAAKGGSVNYSHASLGNVVATVQAALGTQGLSATWETDQAGDGVKITCKITHRLGHSEETSLQAAPDDSGKKNAIQQIGSTITYLQRYTLLAITGLATHDQDDDGAGSGKKPAEVEPPDNDEWGYIDEICKQIPAPSGMRVDRNKVASICYENKQAYPHHENSISPVVKWLSGMDRPELFMPENRSQAEIDLGMPGDEDSQPDHLDTPAPSISFKCNACIRTYWYGRKEGFGVRCECGNGTLEESDPRDKAIREADKTAAEKFGKENEQVELRYYCTKCDKEFEDFKIKGVCANTDCLSRDIIDRQKS